MKTTSDRIKEGLELRDMKQADLAKLTGISKGALSSYIAGRYTPKQDNIFRIAKALNVNEAWLMGADIPHTRNENDYVYLNEEVLPANKEENDLLLKFNALDASGKEAVLFIVDHEYKRCMMKEEKNEKE